MAPRPPHVCERELAALDTERKEIKTRLELAARFEDDEGVAAADRELADVLARIRVVCAELASSRVESHVSVSTIETLTNSIRLTNPVLSDPM